jgi:hypothetical protein
MHPTISADIGLGRSSRADIAAAATDVPTHRQRRLTFSRADLGRDLIRAPLTSTETSVDLPALTSPEAPGDLRRDLSRDRGGCSEAILNSG